MAKILDGKLLAEKLHGGIKAEVDRLVASGKRAPGLGVILVGGNPASKAYVGTKTKVAIKVGFKTFDHMLAENASYQDVADAIQDFNSNPAVDGILLQLPLPKVLVPKTNQLLDLIDPAKDADGLHPWNQGLLQRGEGKLRPCTPMGSLALIDLALSGIDLATFNKPVLDLPKADLSGKRAVVVGRSILVGKPVASLLLERNATVTMAHSKTKDLADVVRQADIVVAAVGVAHLVKGDWIRPGAVVIDVGMNRLENGKLTGDVEFEAAAEQASAITPVPGGVGPMTVCMLMRNTLEARKLKG